MCTYVFITFQPTACKQLSQRKHVNAKRVARFGTARFHTDWAWHVFGTARFGTARFGSLGALRNLARHGMPWNDSDIGTANGGTAWHGNLWHGTILTGTAQHGI